MKQNLSRRDFLRAGALTLLGTAGVATITKVAGQAKASPLHQMGHGEDAMAMAVGEVDHQRNGFNPSEILTDFDYGMVSTLENGQTLREYVITAINKDIEVVPGIVFPAWVYNGRLPGPTIRCKEGDRIRIRFLNGSAHPHSMHFHGIHTAEKIGR